MSYFVSLFLLCLTFAFPSHALHIVLDPGHGGTDRGARQHGYEEAQLALDISLKLAQRLKKDPQFRVTLTRHVDTHVPLADRNPAQRGLKGDLFLSLHLNSSLDPRARGPEFYIQNQLPPDEESLFLAGRENGLHEKNKGSRPRGDVATILEDLQRGQDIYDSARLVQTLKSSFSAHVPRKRPQLRQAPFFVLSEVQMPSALLELGYLSNAEEAQWFSRSENQDLIVESIYSALKRFKREMDKGATSRL